MTEGKMIQEMVGAISWAKNGAFSEKKCQKIAVDAAKAYADAQVAAKDADLKRITHERDVLCEIRDMSYREIAALKADKERMREGISDIDIIMDDSNLSISEARHAVFSKVQSLLSPADDTYDSGKFGAPNNLDRPSTECLCSHTIDGRLAKQCDNCRNKPFVTADGDGVEETKDENGLLPCPFCGGKASGLSVPFGYFSVECGSCKFFLMEKESVKLATDDWNRRAGRGIEG